MSTDTDLSEYIGMGQTPDVTQELVSELASIAGIAAQHAIDKVGPAPLTADHVGRIVSVVIRQYSDRPRIIGACKMAAKLVCDAQTVGTT